MSAPQDADAFATHHVNGVIILLESAVVQALEADDPARLKVILWRPPTRLGAISSLGD